jgi:hypothetical protein
MWCGPAASSGPRRVGCAEIGKRLELAKKFTPVIASQVIAMADRPA